MGRRRARWLLGKKLSLRRLLAHERLGKRIPCVVLKIESLLAGEYAENVFRKQFTWSEKAAIDDAIEEELGNRQAQGRPPKVAAIAATYEKGKTADIAAKRAGFNSAETFERAKKVVDRGAEEVIAAMDNHELSISAAVSRRLSSNGSSSCALRRRRCNYKFDANGKIRA